MNHSWESDQSPAFKIEQLVRRLLRGEFSTLSISFNEHSVNYMTAKQELEDFGKDFEEDEWVSRGEKELALEKNSVWMLRWFPDTPIGSCTRKASSLEALLTHVGREFGIDHP